VAKRPPFTALIGRDRELRAIDAVLETVRHHRSDTLVLVGAPGVGKSALLDYAEQSAEGCRVLRSAGVEFEVALPYAGLHQLCAPLLEHVNVLPDPQRRSVETAFGRADGVADPFLLGLAFLDLLAEASVDQPLVCLIDDIQWLDPESLQVLRFVSRRLLAEPVALLVATRDSHAEHALPGLPSVDVAGLGRMDAGALLDSAILGVIDPRVRDRILAEARGNPLALLELPRVASPTELGGGFEVLTSRPLTESLEASFHERLTELTGAARQLLTTAAADPTGEVAVLWRAADLQGLGDDAARMAEASGLLTLDTHVRFRHPLVRAIAYQAAPPPDRRAAHHALALAVDESQPDRRAWHRAQAASAPEEELAAELVSSATRARARGGLAAAAVFLERAAQLTPDQRTRGERAFAAAQAEYDAGAHEPALELLAIAESCPLDDLTRAQLLLLRARIVFALRRGSDAPALLLEAAHRLEVHDISLARDAFLEAIGAAIFVGRLGGSHSVLSAAEASRIALVGSDRETPAQILLEALTARWVEGYAAGVGPMRRAIEGFRQQAAEGHHDLLPWLWLACPVLPGPFGPELWDDELWLEMSSLAVHLARTSGALTVLPVSLMYRAGVSIHMGEFREAKALLEESDAISAATGFAPGLYARLLLVAWSGIEAEALSAIESRVSDATSRGEGRVLGLAGNAKAVLYNGLGRYDLALDAAREAVEYDDMGFYGWSLSELVEAGARTDAADDAAAAMAELDDMCLAANTDWALGVRARSLALLRDGDEAEALYREAIQRLARTRMAVHLARSHLVFGEWLRREHRRAEATEHLTLAHAAFSEMGAEGFAERSRRELMVAGATVQTRGTRPTEDLTPQERQIAHLAADGCTNPEIGAQLFISPRTVEYHLGKVFRKLGINARRALGDALRGT